MTVSKTVRKGSSPLWPANLRLSVVRIVVTLLLICLIVFLISASLSGLLLIFSEEIASKFSIVALVSLSLVVILFFITHYEAPSTYMNVSTDQTEEASGYERNGYCL